MSLVSFTELDRSIARAARALGQARRELRRRPNEAQNPLWRARDVSTRSLWQDLGAWPKDPIAAALRAWVAELTVARVTWQDELRLGAAWADPRVLAEGLDASACSPRAARARWMAATAAPIRARWAEAFASHAGEVQSAAIRLAERRAEAFRLLGSDDANANAATSASALAECATQFLERTRDLGPSVETWHDAFAAMLARDATEGWPSRLSLRWLNGLFVRTGLFDGLSLELELPDAVLGGATFARALSLLGAAYADADAPRSAPFALARPPHDLRRARRSALFGSLVADPEFCRHALGLGRGSARDQARRIGRALLMSTRLLAAKVMLGQVLLDPPRTREDRFEAVTELALGRPVPAALAAVLPSLDPSDAFTFAGIVLSARDRVEIIEQTDEDWFRSPHAAHLIRDEQATLASSPNVPVEAVGPALEQLIATLESLLG